MTPVLPAPQRARGITLSSIAVLPFLFLTEIEKGSALSLGFADALITILANLEEVAVAPTSKILNYAAGADPAKVCRELQGMLHARRGQTDLGVRCRSHHHNSHEEHPVIVLDLRREPGRTFRVIPSQMWSVETNLSIANTDFFEFADAVGDDGIFREFPRRRLID